MGHETETLDRQPPRNRFEALKKFVKNLARFVLRRIRSIPSEYKRRYVTRELRGFRNRYLTMSPPIRSESELRCYYKRKFFDAFVVGSDQVWRPRYSPSLSNYYLDFLDDLSSKAKRISYAASFGVDVWEYSGEDTSVCKALVAKFSALSVRERSAIDLCETYFGVNPEWLVDPTLLLDAEDYRQLFANKDDASREDRVVSYVLDPNLEKKLVAQKVSDYLACELNSLVPEENIREVPWWRLVELRYPSVEAWLQCIADARFVVTDSFHGCVFCIIFNKPFVALGNQDRGLTRFQSLLSMFGLEGRLVLSPGDLDLNMLDECIDWVGVEKIRSDSKRMARLYLENSLATEDSCA